MEITAFLGCSRGLGGEVVRAYAAAHPQAQGVGIARNQNALEELGRELKIKFTTAKFDFADENAWPQIMTYLADHNICRLFYFAGGGPYGYYQDKNWQAHQWAYKVNFLAPAYLLHGLLSEQKFADVRQVIFVGSAVADDQPDPRAASYAAAKHALRGLIGSIIKEESPVDVRLFRPSYMDTTLLPKNAKPRIAGLLQNPGLMAQEFIAWADDPAAEKIKTIVT